MRDSTSPIRLRATPSDGRRTWGYANGDARLANRSALGQLPDGSLLVLEQHAAKLDADKKPVMGPDGYYVADRLVVYSVMERGAGWGKDIPEILRNEDWQYAVYTPARQLRPGVKSATL